MASILLVWLACLPIMTRRTSASFTKIVSPGHTDCMAVRVMKNVRGAYLSGNFFFVDVPELPSGRPPSTPRNVNHADYIRARLMDVASGKELWTSKEGSNSAHFTAQGSAGKRYQLCLSNGDVSLQPRMQRDGNHRQIGFHLRVHPLPMLQGEDDDKHAQDDDDADDDDDIHFKVEPLEELTYDLFDKLDDLLDMYEYFQIKEGGQWTMISETLSAVTWWAIFHLLFVFAVAGLQVLYIRRVVEKKRYL